MSHQIFTFLKTIFFSTFYFVFAIHEQPSGKQYSHFNLYSLFFSLKDTIKIHFCFLTVHELKGVIGEKGSR